MASIARSSMLRHALSVAPSKPTTTRSASTLISSASRTSKPLARQSIQSSLVRNTLSPSSRIAAFHASGSKAILPPLPQTIKGTLNDPAPVPEPSPSHGSYHWSFERVMAGAIVPLTIAPFVGGSLNPVMDSILCATIILHSHIGFESCITDYFPRWRVPKTRMAADWTLRISTLLVAIGLYEFETNDVGVTAAIARIWKA